MPLLADLDISFSLANWAAGIVASLLVYWVSWLLYTRTLHPLAKIPGPLWPAVSRTWLMYRMYQGDLEIHQRALHERSEVTPGLMSTCINGCVVRNIALQTIHLLAEPFSRIWSYY